MNKYRQPVPMYRVRESVRDSAFSCIRLTICAALAVLFVVFFLQPFLAAIF